jgi:hypothetical protein
MPISHTQRLSYRSSQQYHRNIGILRYWTWMECNMKTVIAIAVIATALAPLGVLAQERTGDAALGALSGAVVFGPVGVVAGAVVGYTTGPAIASSWGLRRHGRHYHRR